MTARGPSRPPVGRTPSRHRVVGAPRIGFGCRRHRRITVRVSLGFVVAAALAAVIGRTSWLPLHLFLAGAVVLAISGVSLMLAVTRSAAPAPPNGWVVVQRTCIAAGAIGIAVRRLPCPPTSPGSWRALPAVSAAW